MSLVPCVPNPFLKLRFGRDTTPIQVGLAKAKEIEVVFLQERAESMIFGMQWEFRKTVEVLIAESQYIVELNTRLKAP
jgi:hypothetical protein